MTEVAGEVCDGFFCHGFTTEKYLREVTLPALERGRAKVGKTLDGFEIVGPSFVVTGNDEEEMSQAATRHPPADRVLRFDPRLPPRARRPRLGRRSRIELNALSKQGEWAAMGELIDDEILNAFAVVAEPEQVAPELLRRYGDVIARIRFYAPYRRDPDAGRRSSTSCRRRSVDDAITAAESAGVRRQPSSHRRRSRRGRRRRTHPPAARRRQAEPGDHRPARPKPSVVSARSQIGSP